MATPYKELTDAEKLIAEPSGLYPSGEAHFFDKDVQGITQGTKKFISPTDDGTFIDPITNNLYEFQSGTYLLGGSPNNGNDDTVKNFVLEPSGLIFELLNDDEKNVLSSSDTYKNRSHDSAFGVVNPAYIYHIPIPGGGSGLMDKTPTFSEYTPNQSGNLLPSGSIYTYGTPPTYERPAPSGEDTITISSGNSP